MPPLRFELISRDFERVKILDHKANKMLIYLSSYYVTIEFWLEHQVENPDMSSKGLYSLYHIEEEL